MSKLDDCRIEVAALSGRVVIARLSKKEPNVALETKDSTSDFLRAIMNFVGVGCERQFGSGDDQYIVSLRKVQA